MQCLLSVYAASIIALGISEAVVNFIPERNFSVNDIIIPILQLGKLRCREVKSGGYTASNWQRQNLTPRSFIPESECKPPHDTTCSQNLKMTWVYDVDGGHTYNIC